jgi:hypothetical protein
MARSSFQQIPSWVPRRQERARVVSLVNAAVVHGGEAFRLAQSGGQAVAGEELTVQPVDTGETGNGEAKARVPFLGTARARVAKTLRPHPWWHLGQARKPAESLVATIFLQGALIRNLGS